MVGLRTVFSQLQCSMIFDNELLVFLGMKYDGGMLIPFSEQDIMRIALSKERRTRIRIEMS